MPTETSGGTEASPALRITVVLFTKSIIAWTLGWVLMIVVVLVGSTLPSESLQLTTDARERQDRVAEVHR